MTPDTTILTDTQIHKKETIATFRSLRRLDQFMYDSDAIQAGLDVAFSGVGKIGIFLLDCISADLAVTKTGIGKTPIREKQGILERSALVYQTDSIVYLIKTLKSAGLNVYVWNFLGDDDFKYSVSPEYTVDNEQVANLLKKQIELIGNHLVTNLASADSVTVKGWLSCEEDSPELKANRDALHQVTVDGLKTGVLPEKFLQRLSIFVQYRKELLQQAGLYSHDYDPLINKLAIEEMTSFACQGHSAPQVIHKIEPTMPLIFANSFPNLHTQTLDDVCLRIGNSVGGLAAYSYGTIHLPGPERLAKFLGQTKQVIAKNSFMSCGDPTGNKNYT